MPFCARHYNMPLCARHSLLHYNIHSLLHNNMPFCDQTLGNSKREWEKAVVDYSMAHQLRWKQGCVKKIIEDEKKYYGDLLIYSQQHVLIYPYHIADIMLLGLKTSPFQYYYSILSDMLKSDKSYDSLPNFTAADCLRLTGLSVSLSPHYLSLTVSLSVSIAFSTSHCHPHYLSLSLYLVLCLSHSLFLFFSLALLALYLSMWSY